VAPAVARAGDAPTIDVSASLPRISDRPGSRGDPPEEHASLVSGKLCKRQAVHIAAYDAHGVPDTSRVMSGAANHSRRRF
jgi:hypothetical protein